MIINNLISIYIDVCCDHVEGGQYIGPEFQLGQVYDGSLGMEEGETIVLYRPVYVCVRKSTAHQHQHQQSQSSSATTTKQSQQPISTISKKPISETSSSLPAQSSSSSTSHNQQHSHQQQQKQKQCVHHQQQQNQSEFTKQRQKSINNELTNNVCPGDPGPSRHCWFNQIRFFKIIHPVNSVFFLVIFFHLYKMNIYIIFHSFIHIICLSFYFEIKI